MNAATFDTYAAAKRLRDAGFDEDQADAAVSMVRDAVGTDREQLSRPRRPRIAHVPRLVDPGRRAHRYAVRHRAGFVVYLLSQP